MLAYTSIVFKSCSVYILQKLGCAFHLRTKFQNWGLRYKIPRYYDYLYTKVKGLRLGNNQNKGSFLIPISFERCPASTALPNSLNVVQQISIKCLLVHLEASVLKCCPRGLPIKKNSKFCVN